MLVAEIAESAEAAPARHETITFLAANTVRPGTYEQYARAEATFQKWLGSRRSVRRLPQANLDRLVEEYMEHLYFEGATSGEGSNETTCTIAHYSAGFWPHSQLKACGAAALL